MNKPEAVDVDAQKLTLVWQGGVKAELAASFLRKMCQCAKCISEVTGEVMLDRKAVPDDLTLTSAEPTGSYGISLGFSDHHATGIYSFDYLYELSQQKALES